MVEDSGGLSDLSEELSGQQWGWKDVYKRQKLADTANRPELMRLNRMTAALYMTCQGNLFFLSGEEFARTKEGHENTYNCLLYTSISKSGEVWLLFYYGGFSAVRAGNPP